MPSAQVLSRRSPRGWRSTAAAVVAAAVVACGANLAGAVSPRGDTVAGLPAATMAPTLAPLELTQPATGGVTDQGVREALLPILLGPGLAPPLGIVVTDAATGEVVTALAADTSLIPASTVKLLTAAAALEVFGPQHRVTTAVVTPADGSVILVGGGDPQLTVAPRPGTGGSSLTQLAAVTAGQLRAAGTTAVTLAVDDSEFSGPRLVQGWDATDLSECITTPITALAVYEPEPAAECVPDLDPALTAGAAFAELLGDYGIEVTGEVARARASTAGAEVLAEVDSLPMSALVEQMLTDSDNVNAETIGHLLGGRVLGDASFSGGAKATLQVLTELGIPTDGVRLDDASGLSSADRLTVTTVSALLDTAVTDEDGELWPVSSGLAVAGSTGSLAARFDSEATAAGRGDVRAKTGTLTSVSALSGHVVTAQGQLLTFAMITNGADDIAVSRQALDRAASALAACGCEVDAA